MTNISDSIMNALRIHAQADRLALLRAAVSPASSLYYAITLALVALDACRKFILNGSEFDHAAVDRALTDLVEALQHA